MIQKSQPKSRIFSDLFLYFSAMHEQDSCRRAKPWYWRQSRSNRHEPLNPYRENRFFQSDELSVSHLKANFIIN